MSSESSRGLPGKTTGENLFAFPIVGKAGLGNTLFPWARAEIFAATTGARVLAPSWASFRLGPYLRREPEKRRYSGFFFGSEHLHGIRRLWIRLRGQRVPESRVVRALDVRRNSHRPMVVEFEGLDDFFAPLVEEAGLVRDRLLRMTQPALRPMTGGTGDRFIAMHVRRGDITRQGFTAEQLSQSPQYTPLSWFVAMARATRRDERLRGLPMVVFSDGDEEEVGELLRVEGVALEVRRPAIADLWRMSSASLLFASGFSTFGMWASFLGGMPTIYAPGKIQQLVQVGRPSALEMELRGDESIPERVTAATLSSSAVREA